MDDSTATPRGTPVRLPDVALGRATVPTYLALVFVLSWGIWFVGLPRTSGLLQVLVVLAGAWSPTVVALGMVAATGGRDGVLGLLSGLVRWRVPFRWYAAALLTVPLSVALAIVVGLAAGGRLPTLTTPGDLGLVAVPVVFVVNVFVGGPLAEELGWRGYALPLLAEHLGARVAAVAVGVVWALWHLPFYTLSPALDVTAGFPLWAFVPVLVAWSVLVSWVVVNAGGSVLLAVLFHASVNTTLGTLGVVDPTAPLALAGFVLVLVGFAALVAAVGGRRLAPAGWVVPDDRVAG